MMSESTSHPVIGETEARVLGCLIEKELATPESYPLTLNALVNACNQKSNRNPVMSLSEPEVEEALDELRRHRLAALFSGAEARVAKYKQTIDNVFPMDTPERVILCELLLRGPQTPGELRNRCGRLYPFDSLAAVEAALAVLAQRPAGPLVATLPRRPGQKETRHAQLLTGQPPEDLPDAHSPTRPRPTAAPAPGLAPELEARLAALEAEVTRLRTQLADLRSEIGS